MKQSLNLIFLIVLVINVNAQKQMTINQEAPVVQKKEIIINATPEKIWEVLTNIEKWDKWNERIIEPELKGQLEVESTFTWNTNGSKIKSKVHTLISNKVLGWTGKAFGASAIHNWYLEPVERGTKVGAEESMDGWIIKLMKKKMNEKLADDMVYWIRLTTRHMKSQHPAGCYASYTNCYLQSLRKMK